MYYGVKGISWGIDRYNSNTVGFFMSVLLIFVRCGTRVHINFWNSIITSL